MCYRRKVQDILRQMQQKMVVRLTVLCSKQLDKRSIVVQKVAVGAGNFFFVKRGLQDKTACQMKFKKVVVMLLGQTFSFDRDTNRMMTIITDSIQDIRAKQQQPDSIIIRSLMRTRSATMQSVHKKLYYQTQYPSSMQIPSSSFDRNDRTWTAA